MNSFVFNSVVCKRQNYKKSAFSLDACLLKHLYGNTLVFILLKMQSKMPALIFSLMPVYCFNSSMNPN